MNIKKNIQTTTITILFLFLLVNLSAQEIKKTQDLGLWIGATLEYELKKDYTFSLSQDLRLYESLSEMDKYISDFGMEYRINKNFKLGANLRYYFENKKDKTISQDLRYNFDLKFKHKIKTKFKFNYRLRFQTVYENLFAKVSEGTRSNLRNKFGLSYKFNSHNTFYIGTEIFRKFVYYRKPKFNKIRFLLGNKLDTEIGNFDFSFGYERELNSDYPLNYYFGRINYTFKLKHEK